MVYNEIGSKEWLLKINFFIRTKLDNQWLPTRISYETSRKPSRFGYYSRIKFQNKDFLIFFAVNAEKKSKFTNNNNKNQCFFYFLLIDDKIIKQKTINPSLFLISSKAEEYVFYIHGDGEINEITDTNHVEPHENIAKDSRKFNNHLQTYRDIKISSEALEFFNEITSFDNHLGINRLYKKYSDYCLCNSAEPFINIL